MTETLEFDPDTLYNTHCRMIITASNLIHKVYSPYVHKCVYTHTDKLVNTHKQALQKPRVQHERKTQGQITIKLHSMVALIVPNCTINKLWQKP